MVGWVGLTLRVHCLIEPLVVLTMDTSAWLAGLVLGGRPHLDPPVPLGEGRRARILAAAPGGKPLTRRTPLGVAVPWSS